MLTPENISEPMMIFALSFIIAAGSCLGWKAMESILSLINSIIRDLKKDQSNG